MDTKTVHSIIGATTIVTMEVPDYIEKVKEALKAREERKEAVEFGTKLVDCLSDNVINMVETYVTELFNSIPECKDKHFGSSSSFYTFCWSDKYNDHWFCFTVNGNACRTIRKQKTGRWSFSIENANKTILAEDLASNWTSGRNLKTCLTNLAKQVVDSFDNDFMSDISLTNKRLEIMKDFIV